MSDTPPNTIARLSTAVADRYRIDRELGLGGMATVYLAEDIKHHRKVAIKVLHAELSAVLGPDRFLKEIELTANLQHPHIRWPYVVVLPVSRQSWRARHMPSGPALLTRD